MRSLGKHKIAKFADVRLAAQAAILAAALTGTARADDVQGKLSYCKDCHGVSAQGYRGYFPIPRLAGQQPEYLENQLRAFIEHRRTNNIMFNVAHALSPGMVAALAAHFRSLNPPPVGGAPKGLAAEGRKNIPGRRTRRQYRGLRRLPWPGCHGRGRNSAAGGPALSLPHQGIGELGARAGTKSGAARHIRHYEPGGAQLEQVTNRSRRGLCQRTEIDRVDAQEKQLVLEYRS